MKKNESISIVLSTYNRASILEQTLNAFSMLDLDSLDVRFIVVDNNSKDNTHEVLNRYRELLPLECFFEKKPGKNVALNTAIREASSLGEIVVFTDDDIIPHLDWIVKISDASTRWKNYSVFGGRVELFWPPSNIPMWAKEIAKDPWAFAAHDLGDKEVLYPENRNPAGPNYWIRRELLEKGYKFNESIGPHPKNRIMGSETTFLYQLRENGYNPVFIPDAAVQHHVDKELLEPSGILKRAFTNGRGAARQFFLRQPDELKKYVFFKRVKAGAGIIKWKINEWLLNYSFNDNNRVLRQIQVMKGIGWHTEMIKIFKELKKWKKL
ncbi:glycosyltransferase [Marispirochaeta sp.]|uniref:glycosyltransferase n=1 Tax=Marispirochaeta sp. TaxID=2038653 RepID=UPI0029C91275|nr:glycosyltransferase [Marispirochaeta sp.]